MPAKRAGDRDASEPVYCIGPGNAYEEDCLGNGRVHSPDEKSWTRCATCRVERRRRHMAKRSQAQAARKPKRRRGKNRADRPKTLAEALKEADLVFQEHDQTAAQQHPEVRWLDQRKTTNEGRTLEYKSIDLRYSIRRS